MSSGQLHATMSQEHKAMLAHSKDRDMAMTIGQVFPARAAMVEYALTREASAGLPGSEPARIVLTLNETTKLTISRVWWPGVAMTATVRREGRIYSIRRTRGGMHAVTVFEVSEERLPPEQAPMPAHLRRSDSSLNDDPLAVRSARLDTSLPPVLVHCRARLTQAVGTSSTRRYAHSINVRGRRFSRCCSRLRLPCA
jgi:hypothetical protein